MSVEGDRQRVQLALAKHNPTTALHDLLIAFKAEGMRQVAMYQLISEFQQKLDENNPAYNAVVDNMDLIWGGGWAPSHALYETELADSDIMHPDDGPAPPT